MEDVRQILYKYKILIEKTLYIHKYMEYLLEVKIKSVEYLSLAIQIPRNTSWKDDNLVNMVDINERQLFFYTESIKKYKNILIKITDFIADLNEEMEIVIADLEEVIKMNDNKMKHLEIIKSEHIESWLQNKDPWITDIKLKIAIRDLFNYEEISNTTIQTKILIYIDKLKFKEDFFYKLIRKIVKTQSDLHSSLLDSTNLQISNNLKSDIGSNIIFNTDDVTVESKILDTYEKTIFVINKELESKNLIIKKNIEPLKYTICKFKDGLTSEWILVLVVTTRCHFIHIFDIFNSQIQSSIIKKYSKLLIKLKFNPSRCLLQLFGKKKNPLNYEDERLIFKLLEDLTSNIDKFINNLILSINIRNKEFRIEKDTNTIILNDKFQNSLSNLFGISSLKLKCFSLTSCCDLFFSLRRDDKKEEIPIQQEVKNVFIEPSSTLNVKIEENNPWDE